MNCGFLSYWGVPKGLAEVTLGYAKMIQDTHNVFILKQGTNKIEERFKIKAHITEYDKYVVDSEFFKKWLVDNKIDVIVFNEFHQWEQDSDDLTKICKDLGVKTLGYLIFERFHPKQTKMYDRVLAYNHSFERYMRSLKLRNFSYAPVSIDFNEIINYAQDPNDKFRFLHIGGTGGLGNRKNTEAVIKAFSALDDQEHCELIITSQKPLECDVKGVTVIDKNLSKAELYALIESSDCMINASKWESVGIPTLESLAYGRPVITSDVAPMNEYVQNNSNGFVCRGYFENIKEISVNSFVVDIIDLKNKMKMISENEIIQKMMCEKASKFAREHLDLEKNKKYLLEIIDKVTR